MPTTATDAFDTYVRGLGYNPEDLTAIERKALQAAHAARSLGAAPPSQQTDPGAVQAVLDEFLARAAHDRAQGCVASADQIEAAAARAVANGWTPERARLEMIRADRFGGPILTAPAGGSSPVSVLEAGLLLHMGLPDTKVAEWYGPRVTDAATSRGYRTAGFHTVCRSVLAAHGRHVPPAGLRDEDIRQVFDLSRGLQASGGPSTYSLPNILSNVAGKVALAAFQATTATWHTFCRQRAVSDFKQTTNLRLGSVW
ncbi:MAG TPA: hypothetical protein VKJ47_14115 [Candidatus Binatia bacterium]|nr:hypothetical protein [Candidatus Binatia bacterium]